MRLFGERVVKTGAVTFILYLGMSIKVCPWGGVPVFKNSVGWNSVYEICT